MENRIFVKFSIPARRILSLLGFFVFVFGLFAAGKTSLVLAYEAETHSFLTNEAIEFYNRHFPQNPVSGEVKPYLLDGSQHEDNPPRWLNHFFDPVHNRGLDNAVLGNWQKSKDWAKDSDNQNKIAYKTPTLIGSILDAFQQKKISFISSETDFTWQKAVNLYVEGKKEKAFYLLGHILHLVQDCSVPDHTRNDAHPKGSPYESFARQFTFSKSDPNIRPRLQNKTPILLSNLDDYFDGLANYSNKNFYSEDTIEGEYYKLPTLNLENTKIVNNLYFLTKQDEDQNEYFLAVAKSLKDVFNQDKIDFVISNDIVKNSYWSLLSLKSIQYSSGLIDLFLRTAEAKKTVVLQESLVDKTVDAAKNLLAQAGSAVGQTAGRIKIAASNLAFNLGGFPGDGNQEWQLTAEIKTEPAGQTTEAGQATETGQTDKSVEQTSRSAANLSCSFFASQTPNHRKVLLNEIAWMGTTDSAGDEWIELKNISGVPLNLDGYQLVDQKEQIRAAFGKNSVIPVNGFFLLERTDETAAPRVSADKIYQGSLSDSGEGLRLFASGCVLVDEVLAQPQWPAGNKITKQTMERNLNDFSWHSSLIFGGTPKRENSVLASAPADVVVNVEQTQTDAQSRSFSAPAPVSVSAHSGGGAPVIISQSGAAGAAEDNQTGNPNNPAAAVSEMSTSTRLKILISEIQISPIENRFIELYNPNDESVSLTDWYIQRKTQTDSKFESCVSKTYFAGKVIPGKGYFVISRTPLPEADIVLPDLTLTAGNTLRLKNSQTEMIDKVGWGAVADFEGSGPAAGPGENFSVQRKFGGETFLDADNNAGDFEIQSCPSPKAQSRSCSASSAEQPLGAFFVYAPRQPQIGEFVVFNAGSSTGGIVFYQWDFGEGQIATTTQSVIEHTFAASGDFLVQLRVFDAQNNSAFFNSSVAVIKFPIAAHIVISEIQAGTAGNPGGEFVELYNPLTQPVSLAGWSLKRKTAANAVENLVLNFAAASSSVPAKGFLLLAHQNYDGLKIPDLRYDNDSVFLVGEDEAVILENGEGLLVDEVVYAEIPAGKSLERKAGADSAVDSMLNGEDRFGGNGYDSDSPADFILRETSEPQNSFSLPEPRTAPSAVQNLDIRFDYSIAGFIFNWLAGRDCGGNSAGLSYRISEINEAASTIIADTASAAFTKFVDELGREYRFSVQTFDRDGLGSAPVFSTVFAPSLLSSLRFYRNPLNQNENLIEFYYERYPFVPDLHGQGSQWKVMVFYLNSDAEKQPFIFGSIASDWPYTWPGETLDKILRLGLNACGGGYSLHHEMLILPDIPANCNIWGGVANMALNSSELEDNHLLIKAGGLGVSRDWEMPVLTESDYLTAAFYSFSGSSRWSGGAEHFRLAAIDKTRYYYRKPTEVEVKNFHFPPVFSASSSLIFSFDENQMKLIVNWQKFFDPDTLDSRLKYEISWDEGATWQTAICFYDGLDCRLGYELFAEPGKTYSFWVRAIDDWGLTSGILTGEFRGNE